MAYQARRIAEEAAFALVAAHNQRQEDDVASFFHADTTSTYGGSWEAPTATALQIASANASDTPTAVTLVNETKAVLNTHFADDLAHDSAVSAAIATADATDEATAITLANACKAAYNTHASEANVHFTNDATNTVAAADATDAGSLNTLLNEMKGDINPHMVSAPNGAMVRIVPA